MYVAAPVCMVAGVALFAPVTRLFESRVGDFLGWISFPHYLVKAAVIYVFRARAGRLCVIRVRALDAAVDRRHRNCAGRDLLRHPVLPGQ